MNPSNPPRLADTLLRLVLTPRDRETVSGDLFEEYRDLARMHSERAATRWYRRQVAGIVLRSAFFPIVFGLSFGALLGAANLIDTALEPLADDTPRGTLIFVSVILSVWSAVSFVVARRTGTVRHAVAAGAIVATLTMLLFGVANVIRVNVFLDVLPGREDWTGLMVRYRQSGYANLRAFVNHEYLSPVAIIVGQFVMAAIGAVTGILGGTLQKLTGRGRYRLDRSHTTWRS